MGGQHIGLVEPRDIDALMALHRRQRLDAVAIGGGPLVFHVLAGRLHARGELALDALGLAFQEQLGLGDEGVVAGPVDPPDAGRRTAFDLEQQAGPGARREDAVRARAQQKRALQGGQGPVDRAGRGKGAVVAAAG